MAKFISYYDVSEELEQDEDFKAKAMELLSKVDDESTYAGASAVSGLLDYWTTERELFVYERGRVVDDILDCCVTTENPELYAKATRVLYKSLKFDVKELTDKLKSDGFNIPAFLLEPEAVGGDEEVTTKHQKKQKKLIDKERNTTELLDLIYQMFDAFNMKTGDKISKLTAKAAWGQIIAKKYENDLIKQVTGTRKTASIELNGGDIVDSTTFSRTYNRRFE